MPRPDTDPNAEELAENMRKYRIEWSAAEGAYMQNLDGGMWRKGSKKGSKLEKIAEFIEKGKKRVSPAHVRRMPIATSAMLMSRPGRSYPCRS